MALDDLEKIQSYIIRTNLPARVDLYYNINIQELHAIRSEVKDPLDQMILAFELGRAKGYRAGKKNI